MEQKPHGAEETGPNQASTGTESAGSANLSEWQRRSGQELSILEHCIRRLEKARVGPVYALIPHDDQPMQAYLEQRSISFIAGPLDDVRARFALAAQVTGARYIVRATADNPCVDPGFARKSVERIHELGADLFAFSGLPLGCAVEVFSAESLDCRQGPEEMDPSEYREHVSLHIKHHPDLYNVVIEPSGLPEKPRLRLTVDEEADFLLVQSIFQKLGSDFQVADVLELQKRSPELFEINAGIQQRKFPAHLFTNRHSA
tara:strand:- start:12540 stop:13316 length:777 start_codon:yes stop_codon:yes gene_type:complete